MISRSKPAYLIAALLLAVSGLAQEACLAADEKVSCEKFVQSFYDWYVAKSNAPVGKDPLEIALKTRSDVFSPDLCKQLKEDVAASAKSPREIVGLDFDPILNTQAEVQRYKAGKVTSKGNSFLVDVYGSIDGKRSAEPDVQPELIYGKGKWQFVNFHYNVDHKKDDLLHILKILRDDRQTFKK
jgi:hypothetical protein